MSSHNIREAEKLGLVQKLGFGVGDFGFNLYYTGLNLFLMYYYTDVLEIRPGIAGLIFAVPLFWDAITDPMMGVIASRTRTKMGSYRPYILYGMVPLALSFIGMFAAPLLFPSAVIAASAVAHVLFRTCYTVVSIPYTSLSANMTRDTKERSTLASLRMIFATCGALATVFMTLQLAYRFGAGDMKLGFFYVSLLFSVIACLIFLITFFTSKENTSLSETRVSHLRIGSIGESLKLVWNNTALCILISAILFSSIGSAIFSKALVYYVKYVANLELSITDVLLAQTFAAAACIPVWGVISRFLPKKTVWIVGAAMSSSAMALLFAFPAQSELFFTGMVVLMGAAYGAYAITFWSMLPDTVEYAEWRTGVRDESLVFGINQLALKAASGLGLFLLGIFLELSGYVANVEQSETTVTALRVITMLVPLVCTLGAAVLISFYPISEKLHKRLVKVIDHRRLRS